MGEGVAGRESIVRFGEHPEIGLLLICVLAEFSATSRRYGQLKIPGGQLHRRRRSLGFRRRTKYRVQRSVSLKVLRIGA